MNYIFAGRKKVHFTFLDGREMAEEYDIQKNELVGEYIF